jgi:predicted dienelactone hydrolase
LHLLDVLLPVAALAVALAALRAARQRRALRMPLPGRLGTRPSGALGGLGVLVLATLAQLQLAGWRWQLAPIAAASVLLAVVLLMRALGRRARLDRTVAVLTIATAGLSLLLSWALPVRVLPAPVGPHAVGTTTLVVSDPGRVERYGPEPGGPRELVVQVWYPADPAAPVVPAPLVPQAAVFVDLGAAELGLPRFALGHLPLIRGNATADAAALPGRAPVVLLAHGWTGFRTIQSDLAEQLASDGWVVVAADHRFGALVTTFPDGRADLFDPEALPEFGSVPAEDYARLSTALVATFADDLALVLRTLQKRPPAVLDGHLDLGRVAMVGHSTGGGAAFQACAVQPSCGAAVGFDPWVEPVAPEVLRAGTSRPILSLRTEDWVGRPNEAVLSELHRLQRSQGVPEAMVRIDGALHRDFTLIGALSPAGRLLGFAGDTPDRATRAATITWTSRFLDHHVRGTGSDPALEPPATSVGLLERTP